ncbi:MAG: AAA domain-containing protein [Candidatus Gastranaerophilales bacterium]|nr:AAA domain-containing protein [Candidatus Gastranaerophilales bacterium]
MNNKHKQFQIYLKGKNETWRVKDFKHFGSKCEVTFTNDKKFTYNARNVRIVESALNANKSRNCFDYLKEIAEAIGLKAEIYGGKVVNILSYNYSKIDFVMPDSMLGAFLGGKITESYIRNPIALTDEIYPFGFNASQKRAVENALTNKLSIIEGPPGTGKTQTILNIIANAVMRGESVAVVSSNNSATKNVLDKLKKYDVDFIAAYLGNTVNKKDFINSQKSLPNIAAWKIEQKEIIALQQMLKSRYSTLQKKLIQQNELSALKQELSSLELEQKYFTQYYDSFGPQLEPQDIQKIRSSQIALEMWLLCEDFQESKQNVGLIKRVLEFLKFWDRRKPLVRKLLKQYSKNFLIAVLQQRFYELKIAEVTKQIANLTTELESFDFDAKMNEYSDLSAQIFRAVLEKKYSTKNRKIYELNDLKKESKSFIDDYPVILSTTYSLRSCLSNNVMYDYVIVDESSQVDLCTGALALSCAKKAVIVGDLKQLPNVVDSKSADATDAIFEKYKLPEVYRYKKHSLLSAVTTMFPDAPNTLLKEHYRCHPKIIEFCNKKFYDDQLIVLTEAKSKRSPLVLYKTREGNHARNRINQRQIDVIKSEIIPQQKLNTEDGSLGIVTPYRNQTNALQKAFEGMNVKADTVDKFQGQENKVVILSTVDNEISEFTDNANRLNVAISRAVEQLIVVVNDDDSLKDTNVGDLVRYIEYNNFAIIDSKVYSVFDYLYKCYAKRRRKFLAKNKRVSKYDSENLMYSLIMNVLKEKGGNRFDVAVHVPLQMIVRDTSLMTPAEEKYAMNALTHVDFLIFDSIDKSPRLMIEVDGVKFHAEGSRQAERDALKNSILKKYDLPLLRFRTDGSDERQKLLKMFENFNKACR